MPSRGDAGALAPHIGRARASPALTRSEDAPVRRVAVVSEIGHPFSIARHTAVGQSTWRYFRQKSRTRARRAAPSGKPPETLEPPNVLRRASGWPWRVTPTTPYLYFVLPAAVGPGDAESSSRAAAAGWSVVGSASSSAAAEIRPPPWPRPRALTSLGFGSGQISDRL
jgi:hypothetical protein